MRIQFIKSYIHIFNIHRTTPARLISKTCASRTSQSTLENTWRWLTLSRAPCCASGHDPVERSVGTLVLWGSWRQANAKPCRLASCSSMDICLNDHAWARKVGMNMATMTRMMEQPHNRVGCNAFGPQIKGSNLCL